MYMTVHGGLDPDNLSYEIKSGPVVTPPEPTEGYVDRNCYYNPPFTFSKGTEFSSEEIDRCQIQ